MTNVASKALENFVKIEFDQPAEKVIDVSDPDGVDKELIEKQLNTDENLGVFEEQQ